MKPLLTASLFLVGLTPLASAAPAAPPVTVCNVTVDVIDEDPKGTNVRATPGGKVLATLVSKADWIELHVSGQAGDWYEIDRADQIDTNAYDGTAPMWRGKGYVHKSIVGLSGLQQGATIYAGHDERAVVLVKNADGDQKTDLLGCWGKFYKVRIKQATGWTREACTNQNTTCS